MSESSSSRDDKYLRVCDCQKPVLTYVSNRPHSRGMHFYTCPDSSLRGGCKFFRWIDECPSQENSGESHSSKFKMSPEDVTEDLRTMSECMRLMAGGLKHMDAEVAALRKWVKLVFTVLMLVAVAVFFK
ncbi:hypothetical protein C2S51_027724 [Perilla frutescens var. frutescens]|nr:hypothetical protein C2S51_027724 [Perilla frutescens var. frutescens]